MENREKWRKLVAKSSVVPQRPFPVKGWMMMIMKLDINCLKPLGAEVNVTEVLLTAKIFRQAYYLIAEFDVEATT